LSERPDDIAQNGSGEIPEPDYDTLEERLGITFKNRALANQALVHKSLTNELGRSGLESNERLEFLGDAVLGAVVAEQLYHRFPDRDEGQLTLMRSALVRASTLASWARQLGLGELVLMGFGEHRHGGRDREPLLARTFEAVLGAIYIDRGYRAARALVRSFVRREMASLKGRSVLDSKSRLQQVSQALFGVTPTYEVLEVSGLGHSPVFRVKVVAGGEVESIAEGPSKQIAQQSAAAEALSVLEPSFVLHQEEMARRAAEAAEEAARAAEEAAADAAEQIAAGAATAADAVEAAPRA
jgi:ribonuclease III